MSDQVEREVDHGLSLCVGKLSSRPGGIIKPAVDPSDTSGLIDLWAVD